jgi:hypothetical protein
MPLLVDELQCRELADLGLIDLRVEAKVEGFQ